MSKQTFAVNKSKLSGTKANAINEALDMSESLIELAFVPVSWLLRGHKKADLSVFIKKWYFGNF